MRVIPVSNSVWASLTAKGTTLSNLRHQQITKFVHPTMLTLQTTERIKQSIQHSTSTYQGNPSFSSESSSIWWRSFVGRQPNHRCWKDLVWRFLRRPLLEKWVCFSAWWELCSRSDVTRSFTIGWTMFIPGFVPGNIVVRSPTTFGKDFFHTNDTRREIAPFEATKTGPQFSFCTHVETCKLICSLVVCASWTFLRSFWFSCATPLTRAVVLGCIMEEAGTQPTQPTQNGQVHEDQSSSAKAKKRKTKNVSAPTSVERAWTVFYITHCFRWWHAGLHYTLSSTKSFTLHFST